MIQITIWLEPYRPDLVPGTYWRPGSHSLARPLRGTDVRRARCPEFDQPIFRRRASPLPALPPEVGPDLLPPTAVSGPLGDLLGDGLSGGVFAVPE